MLVFLYLLKEIERNYASIDSGEALTGGFDAQNSGVVRIREGEGESVRGNLPARLVQEPKSVHPPSVSNRRPYSSLL